jgi:hypothetical protein
MDVAKMPHSRHPPKNKEQFHYGLIASLALVVFLAIGGPASTSEPNSPNAAMGEWRMIRTKNPKGGPDAVAVSHTADMSRSDLDLAGMMVKCADYNLEIAIVVVRPFPPRVQPQVTFSALGKEWRFVASTVPPGAEVILPAAATSLVRGTWQAARDLTVHIEAPGRSLGGVISIEGLEAASAALAANCLPP